MFQLWESFISDCRMTMRRAVGRIVLAATVVVLLPTLVAAYTLVLRDGRQIEASGKITVTASTLTYERAPGFNVTLNLSIIDIPATERINHLPPGGFVKLTEARSAQQQVETGSRRVTITNAQLEPSRRARLQSERAYEQRRRELGLPTLEETRRREQMEAEQIRAALSEQRTLHENDEAYWRGRANELRSEFVEVNGQISYLNGRLAELPTARVWTGTMIGPGGWVLPGVPFPSRRWTGTPMPGRGGIPVWPGGTNVSGQVRFGAGPVRVGATLNPGFGRVPFGQGRGGFGSRAPWSFGSPYPYVLVSQPPPFDQSYERAALTEKLNEMLTRRAGIQARWRLLEEEARRAGAPPGWLRP
ncbi:MAG: hypothetical protein QOD75_1907 [Blastocatellia bacterium]|jgi:hypothetical protein|nr:hypothetical protein [Blastocatellia bacterium]